MRPHSPAEPAARPARAPGRPADAPDGGGRFPDMGPLWTLANGLSVLRMLLIAPIAGLVYTGGSLAWIVGLIALAVGTDFLDGRVARATGTVSEWGKVLDATADKLAAAAITVALLTRPTPPTLPLWFVVLAVSRDALLAAGGLVQTRRLGRFTSSLGSGKVAVALLAATVTAAVLRAGPGVMDALVLATTLAMAVSVVAYTVRFAAIARHGRAALSADGTTLRPEFRPFARPAARRAG